MEKNNIKKNQNVFVSEEENTLDWLEVQNAFKKYSKSDYHLENTEFLAENVISLPIHTELENSNQDYIINKVIDFFK